MEDFTQDELEYVLQFVHPEKFLGALPHVDDAAIAPLFGMLPAAYRETRGAPVGRACQAAEEMLAVPEIVERVDALPFGSGQTVVGLGDSITDDDQSWFTILRHLCALRRPDDRIRFVNAGVSGDTTTHVLCRFLDVVAVEPDWIICLAGTNDCRRHGLDALGTVVSLAETERNVKALRHFASTQTNASWTWMTPATVIEELVPAHWFLGQMQISWKNEDLAAVADVIRAQEEPCVDLQSVFGQPADPSLLLEDGLHPSLKGQVAITTALLDLWAG